MPIRPPYTPPSMPASHPRDFLDYALVREPSLGRLDPAEALALARQVCEELYWMSYQDAATQYEREREDEAAAELAREEAESERDFNENPQWQDAREDARYREEAVAGPPWWAVSQRATLDPDYEYGIQQMAQALVKRLPPYLATLGYPPTANGVILPIDPFSVRIAFQSGEHLQVFVLLRLDIGRDEYTFASCIACAVQTRGGTYLYTAPSEPVEGIYPEEALQDPKRWLNMGLQYPIMLDTPSVKEPVAKALGGLLAPAIPFLARGQGCRLVKEPYMDLHVVPRPDGILIGHVYDNGDPDLFALWPRVSTDGISTKLGERLQFMWVGGRRVPSGPDFSLQRTWLSNLRAYGFAKAKALLLPQTRWTVNRTGPLDVGGVERLSVSEVKGRLKEAYKTNRKARALAGNVVAGGARLLGAPSWAVTTAWAGQKLGDAALDKVMSKVGLYDPEEVEGLYVDEGDIERLDVKQAAKRAYGGLRKVRKGVEAAAAAGAIGATAIGAPGWAAGIALAGQQATGHIMDKAAQKAGLYDGPEEPKSGPAPRRWAAPGWKRKKSPEAPVDRRLFVYYAAPASVAERLEQEGIADARRAPLWIKRRYADQDKAAQEAKGRKAIVFEVDVTGLTLGSHPTSEDAVTFEGPLPATRFRRLPDQGSVERLSASEVIDSGQCLSEDELDEDEVFYHATPSSNVAAILRDGLQPGHGRTFDTEGWSKGKVFVSQGFANAHRWAEYIAEQSGEDVTILQLTPGPWSKGLKLDKVAHEGDNDPCAFYTTKRVPPGLIEAVETVEAA